MHKKQNYRILVLLLFILIGFSSIIPLLNDSVFSNAEVNPKISTDPVLYANKDYDFNLDDYYDSDDLTHIYTGANFQKTYVPTGQQYNESVSYVNNSETKTQDLGNYPATHSFNEYNDGT